MTTLFFVRHGQSMANLLRVFAGQMDFELSDLGLRQAEKGARFLKDHFSIDAIYSSPMKRAMQTAEPAARLYGLEIIPMEDLRERSIGVWAGRYNEEIQTLYPEQYVAWKNRLGFVPEGGETREAAFERFYAAEAEIISQNKGKNVAVYTHAGMLSALSTVWIKNLPDLGDVSVYGNSSITAISYDDEGIARRIVLKNHQEHLGEDITELPAHLI